MHVDYIIVGQGLAGSAVAVQLLKLGRQILVIDNPDNNSSSRIAAGLFNPITGRKMVRTWLADELFPYLIRFYKEVESETGRKFLHTMPIYRPFFSVEEQNEWMGKSGDPFYGPYIDRVAVGPSVEGIHDEWGGLFLKQCGYVQTTQYIEAVQSLIERKGKFLQELFNEEKLEIHGDHVVYGDVRAKWIIFCQGVNSNRWFSWVPVRPLKGETLNIQTSGEIPEDVIVNRGIYLIPDRATHAWRAGGTYNFHDHQPGATEAGRAELEEKASHLLKGNFSTHNQAWGFRPTTNDRRPLLGGHPDHRPLIYFNGLGTKGVSLSPYFSEVLIRWLENGGTLNKVVDLSRYKSVYSGSPK